MSQVLYYAGIALMGCAAVGAAVALVIFRVTGKRLDRQMEDEYGSDCT